MVDVFITNIKNAAENSKVVRKLKESFPHLKIDFDIENSETLFFPCQHNILRVEGINFNTFYIIKLVNNMGFDCEILEDKICRQTNNNK